MAASRRDCATRRGGHCVTNTGSGFSCVISTITNREYAGDHWSVTRRYRRFATNNGVLINCCRKLLPHCDGLRKKSLKCNHCRKYRQHCRGDQWSPVFYCFVGNHRSGRRNNRTGRRVSSSPKRSPCRLSPGAPATRQCRSRAHAACTRPRWSYRRGSTPRSCVRLGARSCS